MKISLHKPNIEELHKKNINCVDMHFHTVHSDGAATVDELLEKIRVLGIGVAITDHNEIKGVLEAYEKKKKDDFIIPGIEVKSVEKVDLLFYFYDIKELKKFFEKEILPNRERHFYTSKTLLTINQLISLQSKYDCMISVAHPYGYKLRASLKGLFERYEEQLSKVKVFEAINGGNIGDANQKAIDYIKKHKRAYMGGSDGHSIYALGRVLTCSKAKTIKSFLNNIKKKKNIVTGKNARFGKFTEFGNYARNKLKNIFRK